MEIVHPFEMNCIMDMTILDKLQRVQNSASRLEIKSRKFDHVQPLLRSLHWLPVHSTIDYKISTLCFNTLTNSSVYISISLSFCPSTPLPDTSVHPQTHAPCIFLSSELSHLPIWSKSILLHRPNSVEFTALWTLTLQIFSCI